MLAHIWHTYSLLSHNIKLSDIHTTSFFYLKHLRPKSIGRADWPGTLWIQTLPYWGVTTKTRTSFLESGQLYACLRARSLPGTTRAKLASLRHANHWQPGSAFPTRTQKRDLHQSWHCGAVDSKSDSLACPCWQWAKSNPGLVVGFGHISWLMVASWRYQRKSGKPTSIPTLGMSLVSLPICVWTAVPSESSQQFLELQKLGPQKKPGKNKILS